MQGCDAVLNLAALIAIPYSYIAPESYVDTNIRGTLNILETARQTNTAKIVQISTSEVYGTAQYVPIDEVHPLNAQSPFTPQLKSPPINWPSRIIAPSAHQ